MFDNTAIAAAELLALFGNNTAVRIDHKYGTSTMNVVSARTGNIIATVILDSSLAMEYVDYAKTGATYTVHPLYMELLADHIMGQKNFPRPRNMNRSWSPIRLSSDAQAMMEADSGIRFA
jgi:hypothetical protein